MKILLTILIKLTVASRHYGTKCTAHPRKTLVGGKYKEVLNINVNLCLFTSLKSVNKLLQCRRFNGIQYVGRKKSAMIQSI